MNGVIGFVVLYLKAFYASRNKRQEQAKENIKCNGGQRVLEWSAPITGGTADDEFGELIAEIPAKWLCAIRMIISANIPCSVALMELHKRKSIAQIALKSRVKSTKEREPGSTELQCFKKQQTVVRADFIIQ